VREEFVLRLGHMSIALKPKPVGAELYSKPRCDASEGSLTGSKLALRFP
jgi:hypothetical protein